MGRYVWIDQDPQMFLEPNMRAFFVDTRQTAITGDIGGEYGCKPSHEVFAAQGYSPAEA
jgi:hypothetical protein